MKYFASILAFSTILFGIFALSVGAQNYSPLAPIPLTGTTIEGDKTTDMTTYLSGAIKLLLAIGASLAVLMTIVGGTQYVAAGISPDARGKAKDMITNAFIGLALMLTSYLILNSINPKLVEFDLSLKSYKADVTALPLAVDEGTIDTGSSGIVVKGTAAMACRDAVNRGIACGECINCSKIPPEIANKQQRYEPRDYFLRVDLLEKLIRANNIQKSDNNETGNWRVTESWPPTSQHISTCHQNGGCFDANNSGGPTDPQTIKIFYNLFKSVGFNVLYENNKDCAPYTAVGILCKSYPTQTNMSSFHIY